MSTSSINKTAAINGQEPVVRSVRSYGFGERLPPDGGDARQPAARARPDTGGAADSVRVSPEALRAEAARTMAPETDPDSREPAGSMSELLALIDEGQSADAAQGTRLWAPDEAARAMNQIRNYILAQPDEAARAQANANGHSVLSLLG